MLELTMSFKKYRRAVIESWKDTLPQHVVVLLCLFTSSVFTCEFRSGKYYIVAAPPKQHSPSVTPHC